MSVPSNDEMTALEQLIDAHGLYEVVAALAVICGDKADHIRCNWQDDITAKSWDAEGRRLVATASKVTVS